MGEEALLEAWDVLATGSYSCRISGGIAGGSLALMLREAPVLLRKLVVGSAPVQGPRGRPCGLGHPAGLGPGRALSWQVT